MATIERIGMALALLALIGWATASITACGYPETERPARSRGVSATPTERPTSAPPPESATPTERPTSVPPPESVRRPRATPSTPAPVRLEGDGSGRWELYLPQGEWRCRPYVVEQSARQKRQRQLVHLYVNGTGPTQLQTGPFGAQLGSRGDGILYFVYTREGYTRSFDSSVPGRTWEPTHSAAIDVVHALPGTRWGLDCRYEGEADPLSDALLAEVIADYCVENPDLVAERGEEADCAWAAAYTPTPTETP